MARSTSLAVQPVKSQRPVQRQAFCLQPLIPLPSSLPLPGHNQISSFPIPIAACLHRTISEAFRRTSYALPETKSLLGEVAFSTPQTSRHDLASSLGMYPTPGTPDSIPSSKQTLPRLSAPSLRGLPATFLSPIPTDAFLRPAILKSSQKRNCASLETKSLLGTDAISKPRI